LTAAASLTPEQITILVLQDKGGLLVAGHSNGYVSLAAGSAPIDCAVCWAWQKKAAIAQQRFGRQSRYLLSEMHEGELVAV
jgi:hypothetical protein